MKTDLSKQRKEQALKNMSKFLLKGDEMLREHCPDCDIPLLKSKKEGTIYCGGCERPVVTEPRNGPDPKFENIEQPNSKIQPIDNNEYSKIISSSISILFGKLDLINNELASKRSNDIDIDIRRMDLILSLIKRLKNLKK